MANTIISNVGSQLNATGMGFQAHTIYAANSGRWWHFYVGSTAGTIKSAYSSDGITWTDSGTTLTIAASVTSTNDGRDLSVFYKNISSNDVVWLVMGGTVGETAPARGVISGTSITWGSNGDEGTGTGLHEPMGFTVVLDSNNKPMVPTSHFSDYSVERGTNADTGSSWTTGWGSEVDIIGNSITNESHARYLVAYAASGKLLALSGNGSSSTKDSLVLYAYYNGTSWSGDATIGFSAVTADFNDFGACRLSDTSFHVVKRSGTNTYTHRIWNGSSTWSAGNSIPTQTSKGNAGMALISDGTTVWLFIIDSAAGNAVKYITWTAGAWDASWTTLEASSATRNNIGVAPQQDGSGNWLVYWTEGSTSPYAIMCAVLSTSSGTNWTGAASLATDANITAAAVASYAAASALLADLNLAATGARAVPGAASFSTDALLSATAIKALFASASLTVDASLSAQAILALVGAASLSADANLTAAAIMSFAGAASLSTDANLAAAAVRAVVGAAALDTDGNLTATGARLVIGLIDLATDANLTGAGTVLAGGGTNGAAHLVVSAVLSVTAAVAHNAAASLRADGNLSSSAALALSAAAVINAKANLSASGIRAIYGASTLQTDAVMGTQAALHIAAQIAVAAQANTTQLAALALVGASALQTAANITATGHTVNTNWRPPTATVLLQAALSAVLALQADPSATIILQDSPEGTVE